MKNNKKPKKWKILRIRRAKRMDLLKIRRKAMEKREWDHK